MYLPNLSQNAIIYVHGTYKCSIENLRRFFEIDRHYVAVAALKALADMEDVPPSKVSEAIVKYGVDPEKLNPATV